MNKNLILTSNIANNITTNDYAKLESTAEIKLIENTIKVICNKINKVAETIKLPMEWFRKYYSIVLEKEISMKETALLLETQFALIATIFPADISILVRLVSFAWFNLCLLRCKKSIK